jgi:hypothetical protein
MAVCAVYTSKAQLHLRKWLDRACTHYHSSFLALRLSTRHAESRSLLSGPHGRCSEEKVQGMQERASERESCVINDLARLDACPQAGSPVKASILFKLKLRQNEQATA